MNMHGIDVLISEVGPRDGLQSVSPVMPTDAKKQWIAALAASGLREIEVGSFVPAKILPQLADTAEIVAYARTIPDLQVAALVPNLKGAENAVAAGAQKITFPLSVSETHSQKNLRMTHAQAFEQVKGISALIASLPAERRPQFEGSLSTAFGCTLEGEVPLSKVLKTGETLVGLGCDEVGLADTTGYANPAQVKLMIKELWRVLGKDKLTGIHLHNTRGLGLANVLAAFETGLTTFDSSLGGLGGCPFAPGASGNIVTEDLVFMFDAMGVRTGIDLASLLKVREIVKAALPTESMYGFTPDAGVPLHYRQGGAGWGLAS